MTVCLCFGASVPTRLSFPLVSPTVVSFGGGCQAGSPPPRVALSRHPYAVAPAPACLSVRACRARSGCCVVSVPSCPSLGRFCQAQLCTACALTSAPRSTSLEVGPPSPLAAEGIADGMSRRALSPCASFRVCLGVRVCVCVSPLDNPLADRRCCVSPHSPCRAVAPGLMSKPCGPPVAASAP